ncbi:MAG: acyl-CoA dehydrogenase family protein, partial [Hyphomicrobiales bacterium]|nr:acyl-CoA dehydrogenase family protein [Hyphomicrobiales bacterium]
MDLRFTPEEQNFRQEVRSFIAGNLDKETHASMLAGHRPSKEQIVAWQHVLNKKGWATVDWPAEFGGTGWNIIKRHIFREEVQAYPAPEPLAFGVYMVGPVIITFGTEDQKRKFLPRIANL